MNDLTNYVSAECAEKIIQELMELCSETIKKERLKNINAVVELVAFLHPLLTEEQNDMVREITDKIIN